MTHSNYYHIIIPDTLILVSTIWLLVTVAVGVSTGSGSVSDGGGGGVDGIVGDSGGRGSENN